ncbi:MAG TPA: right-handed parallel beta-helix repeat-containing protein [Candidatus Eisenbacteria bacterium]|nr:right-handed parallel beta-helix repeat-containing protein [Candidatus Eisenbacteria bacterium]
MTTAFLFSLLPVAASAAVLHVPADYPTIQQALDAATSGDEVLVAPGTYNVHLLMGAFQSGVMLHSEAGAATTILDAGGFNFVINITNAGPGTEVVGFTIQNGATCGLLVQNSSPLLQDNIIRNNFNNTGGGIYLQASPAKVLHNDIHDNVAKASGGGIYCDNLSLAQIEDNTIAGNHSQGDAGGLFVASNIAVKNNHFLGNFAAGQGGGCLAAGASALQGNEFSGNTSGNKGGGVYVTGSPIVDGNTFVGNDGAAGGGGVYAAVGTPTLSNNLIRDNLAGGGGGGGILVELNTTPSIIGNQILRNTSTTQGGGLHVSFGNMTLTGNTIALNTCSTNGGGLDATGNAHVSLRNCIVSHSQAGGGVFCEVGSSVAFQCDDVWGNSGFDFSGVPNPIGTQGNVSSDPLYCNLGTLDVHLAGSSSCAAAHSAGCGLIGALDVNCDAPVATQDRTWGSIKAQYR